MRFFVTVSFLYLTISALFGQIEKPRHCASHYWDSLTLAQSDIYTKSRASFEKKLSDYIDRKKKSGNNETVYQIPLVVHVVHNNTSSVTGGTSNSNISDEQIFSQIEVLNEDFRRTNADATQTSPIFSSIVTDTKIDFCLATIDPDGNTTNGITRHFSTSLPYDPENTSDNKELKEFGYWPADQYLNIWVTELSDDILGYATFPSDVSINGLNGYSTPITNDGVVIDHRAFGRQLGTVINNYNLGRTATHEVGHWLGLFHIWGDQDNCFATDYCADTPVQFTSSAGCPQNSVSCGSKDMTENYMDYSYDRCLNAFTTDQKERMRAVIETSPRRNALLNSLGCCQINKSASLSFTENFETTFDTTALWTVSNNNFNLVNTPAFDNFSLEISVEPTFPDTFFLITPLIDLTELTDPYLSFLSYHTNKSNPLRLSYSLACTNKWTTVSTTLISETDDWLANKIDLNSIKNFSAIRLRFEYIANNTSTCYLDNINIHDEKDKLETSIYPNPSNGIFYIDLKYKNEQKTTIEVFSTLGNSLASYHFDKSYSSVKEIDISNFSSGIYIFKIHVGDEIKIKKVTLTK